MGEKGRALMKDILDGKANAADVVAYFESPEWQREKAARAAEDLKRWKEGREHLLLLIEKAKSDGLVIDYHLVPLNKGGDSVMVTLGKPGIPGTRTLAFPYYFGKEMVEEQFADLLSKKHE